MQCPERGTLRNSYTSSGGGLIRDLMGAKTERLILAFSFGGISLRALHQARVCISRVVSYRKHHHDFSYVYPPSRRVALARRAALAREPRAGEQSGAAPLPNARSRRHCWISDIARSAGALDGTFGVTPLFAESLRAARHLVRRMAMRGGWWRPGVCQREGAAAGVWWAHRRIARCSPHGRAAVVAGPRCNHETSV